jgi:hypothetical protein
MIPARAAAARRLCGGLRHGVRCWSYLYGRWYLEILFKRVGATLTQWKLWPYGRRLDFFPGENPHEGVVDDYYGMTTTIDVGIRAWEHEVPVAGLILPTWILIGVAIVGNKGLRTRIRARSSSC